jgi:hypothetical protein
VFAHAEAFAASFDAPLHGAGLSLAGGGFVERRYHGVLGGCPAVAKLSVTVANQTTPMGYYLTVEVQTGVRARWIAGTNVPLLLRGGMTPIGEEAPGQPLLRAHDATWGARLLDDPQARGALGLLLRDATFLEHRPDGSFQVQIQRPGGTEVPDLAGFVRAAAQIVGVVRAPPAPSPVAGRWSDNRGLALAVIAVVVVAVFAGAVAAVVLLVG